MPNTRSRYIVEKLPLHPMDASPHVQSCRHLLLLHNSIFSRRAPRCATTTDNLAILYWDSRIMAHPSSDRNETIIRSILFLVVVLLTLAIIVYLKRSSDVPLTPEGFAARDSVQRMATPDTTATPAEDYPLSDTVATPPADTVSMDLRLPADAGYEDGYFAGLQDGLDDMERASYDESSKFPTAAQRRNYADAYKRGYAQGFADGQQRTDEDEAPTETGEMPNPVTSKPLPAPAAPHSSPAHNNKVSPLPKATPTPPKK